MEIRDFDSVDHHNLAMEADSSQTLIDLGMVCLGDVLQSHELSEMMLDCQLWSPFFTDSSHLLEDMGSHAYYASYVEYNQRQYGVGANVRLHLVLLEVAEKYEKLVSSHIFLKLF